MEGGALRAEQSIHAWHRQRLAAARHALALQWHQGLFGALIYVAAIGLIAALALAFVASPRAGDLPLVAIAAIMSIAAFQSVATWRSRLSR